MVPHNCYHQGGGEGNWSAYCCGVLEWMVWDGMAVGSCFSIIFQRNSRNKSSDLRLTVPRFSVSAPILLAPKASREVEEDQDFLWFTTDWSIQAGERITPRCTVSGSSQESRSHELWTVAVSPHRSDESLLLFLRPKQYCAPQQNITSHHSRNN